MANKVIVTKKKHSRKLAILGFWVFVLIILSFFFIKWTSSPTKGTINVVTKAIPSKILDQIKFEKINNKYFTAKYSSDYKVAQNESSSSGTMTKIVLLGSDMNSKRIIYSSTETKEIDVKQVSGVQYRDLKTDLYKSSLIKISDHVGLLYQKTDGSFEKSLFFLKDGILTTISMTAPSTNEDLDKDFTVLLNNFSFTH